jgi:hypothetical protein
MANKKFTELLPTNATPSLVGTDILAVTVDPGGATPVSNKTTISNLMTQAPVQSVNTATGAVVLDADDIDDSSTSHKFVTASDIINLGNLSGTNTGDQDLSALATQVSLGNHESLTSLVHGISAFGATLVDDTDEATARATLGVDAAGTDNSTDVTLATVANNYLTLSGQEITAGIVPVSLGGTGSGILATARANLGLGTAATTASTDYATAAQGTLADSAVQPAGIANMVETTDSIDVLADVDTSTVAPTNDDLLKWDGTNFVPGTVTVDVDTPLTTALRGTDSPHIGSSPNQSFKVMDNPYQSAMVVADEDGNITYLLKDTGAEVRVALGASGTPTRFALASDLPAFTLENDSGEPDIEVTDSATGEKISVISGDSDTKGANGLPMRQGYNFPDIGANPAPLLISGGTIA